MALIEVNWNPNRKDLRSFGLIAVIATFLISLLLYVFKGLGLGWVLPIFLFGVVIFCCSRISLKLTRIIYLGLTLVTIPIGLVVSFLLMACFYFLVLSPLGLVFRLIGRDALCRKFEPNTKTYWLRRKSHKDSERYFRPF